MSDFYIMELIEGCKMFWKNSTRVHHFARLCGFPFAGEAYGKLVCDFYLAVYMEVCMYVCMYACLCACADMCVGACLLVKLMGSLCATLI